MKKLRTIFIAVLMLFMINISVCAASDVPETVLDAMDSVVRIVAEYDDVYSTGTGFVVKNDDDGTLIATNYHVLDGTPNSVYIYVDGSEVYAEIVAYTEQKDMCIIKVDTSAPIKALKLAQETAKRGEAVYAAGFPGAADMLSDYLLNTSEDVTVTDGIISAIREMTPTSYGQQVRYLQITADINSGNSGGPLFNSKGEVVGINTLGVNDAQGIFGAIDIQEFKSFAAENNIELSSGKNSFVLIICALIVVLLVFLVFLIVLVIKTERKGNEEKSKKYAVLLKKVNIKLSILAVALLVIVLLASVCIKNTVYVKNYAESDEFGEKTVSVPYVLKLLDPQLCDYIEAGNMLADKKYDNAKTEFEKQSGYMNADNMVLECDYCYAGHLADINEFDQSISIYRYLSNQKYKDSYSNMNAVYYRKACYLLEEQEDYIGAYKIIKSIKEFVDDEILMEEYQQLIYLQGQYLYRAGYYNAAKEYFSAIQGYSDAYKYIRLSDVCIYGDSLPNAATVAQNLINDFYFEDTNEVILINGQIASEFLKGEWSTEDGTKGFKVNEDGSSRYWMPVTNETEFYYIYNGEWRGYNAEKSRYTVQLKIKAVEQNKLEVYCCADKNTYYLYRK